MQAHEMLDIFNTVTVCEVIRHWWDTLIAKVII